jgi:hypothetical protein
MWHPSAYPKIITSSTSSFYVSFQEDPLHPLLSVLAPDGDIVLVTLTNRKDAKKFLDAVQGKTMAQLAALCPQTAGQDTINIAEMPKKTKVQVT